MKMPKEINDYCKKCNGHTMHKLKQFKAGKARAMAKGQRRNVEKKKGYGGKAEFTATVKKQNKHPTFVATCTVCKKSHYFVIGSRMKKVELQAA